MNSNEIKELEQEYTMHTYRRYNLCIAKGKGATCVSPEEKEYIDFSSGIGVNSLGYCDEGWVSGSYGASCDFTAYLQFILYRTVCETGGAFSEADRNEKSIFL